MRKVYSQMVFSLVFICFANSLLASNLHDVASIGDENRLQWYLSRGEEEVDALKSDNYNDSTRYRCGLGSTALRCAVENNQEQASMLLLDYGANPMLADLSRLLYWAARDWSIDTLQSLLDAGGEKDASRRLNVALGDWGETPLHAAALRGRAEIVKLLLKYGAKINMRDTLRQTPLHMAVKSGNVPTIQLLLETKKTSVNLTDYFGRIPLHDAAKNGNLEIVQKLLLEESNVEIADDEGSTPLHEAVISRNKEIIEVLLKAGANVNSKDSFGETPLDIAHSNSCDDLELLLQRYKKAEEVDVPKCLDIILNEENKVINLKSPINSEADLENVFLFIKTSLYGDAIINEFFNKYKKEEIKISVLPRKDLLKLIPQHIRHSAAAAFVYDGKNKKIFIEKNSELGITAIYLFHEIIHALDQEYIDSYESQTEHVARLISEKVKLQNSCSAKDIADTYRQEEDKRHFKTERKAYDAQWSLLEDLKKRHKCYENYIQAYSFKYMSDNDLINEYQFKTLLD